MCTNGSAVLLCAPAVLPITPSSVDLSQEEPSRACCLCCQILLISANYPMGVNFQNQTFMK